MHRPPMDIGAPAEWLGEGVGYAGERRMEKEKMFLSGICRTMAEANGVRCRASWGIRAVYGTV